MCMLATARCLAQPYFSIQSILRAILRDEYIAWYKVRLAHTTQISLSTVVLNSRDR